MKQKSILSKEVKLYTFYLILSFLFKSQFFTHDKDAVLLTAECTKYFWEKDIIMTFYWVRKLQSKCIYNNSSSFLRWQKRRICKDNKIRRKYIKIKRCRQRERNVITVRKREDNHCKLLRQQNSNLWSKNWKFCQFIFFWYYKFVTDNCRHFTDILLIRRRRYNITFRADSRIRAAERKWRAEKRWRQRELIDYRQIRLR